MFEILTSWKDRTEFIARIEDLHEMLNNPRSHRKDFKEFRTRVLEKTRKAIHKNTALQFAWEPIRDGRRVGSIRFVFTQKRAAESKFESDKKASAKAVSNARKTPLHGAKP